SHGVGGQHPAALAQLVGQVKLSVLASLLLAILVHSLGQAEGHQRQRVVLAQDLEVPCNQDPLKVGIWGAVSGAAGLLKSRLQHDPAPGRHAAAASRDLFLYVTVVEQPKQPSVDRSGKGLAWVWHGSGMGLACVWHGLRMHLAWVIKLTVLFQATATQRQHHAEAHLCLQFPSAGAEPPGPGSA
ncbi:hypothetical protein MMC14_010449, partial [Varicellaria rhodocarpa]|nr:hypothetical protein [Varicellaria rhodocarpa]